MKFVFKQKAKQVQSSGKARKTARKHAKHGERLPVSGGLSHVVINTILRTI